MSEMRLIPEPAQFVKARTDLTNSGARAEALATAALEALNHLFEQDGNTIRNGDKWYGLLVNNEEIVLIDHDEELGRQLRINRQILRYSLAGVEHVSGGEFKASVLGAYERGERAISVKRLQSLCQVYGISARDLL